MKTKGVKKKFRLGIFCVISGNHPWKTRYDKAAKPATITILPTNNRKETMLFKTTVRTGFSIINLKASLAKICKIMNNVI